MIYCPQIFDVLSHAYWLAVATLLCRINVFVAPYRVHIVRLAIYGLLFMYVLYVRGSMFREGYQ